MAWGELLYLCIYIGQQLGVMLGVGSMTVLVCTHLVALHHGEQEAPDASYAHAAHSALSFGFLLIIITGAGAVGYHYVAGELEVLLAPAFLLKWALVGALLVAHVVQGRLRSWSNVVYGFAAGSWYALFLVHSVAPVASWTTLGSLYAGWMVFFALVWTAFVLLLRPHHKVAVAPAAPAAAEVQKPVLKPVVPPPTPKPAPQQIPKPVPKPVVPPAPVIPKPAPPPPVPKPAPLPPPPPPKHELPAVSVPVPVPVVVVPVPQPPKPALAPLSIAKQPQQRTRVDHGELPALRVMPQTPADISRHDRPAVVKLN